MALDAMAGEFEFDLDAVINYSLDEKEIVRRLSGRRTCLGCGRTYHVEDLPPHVEDVCDACSGKLIQRSDDRPEAITVRLAAYHSATAPLVEYYETRNLLINIDASGSPSEIFHRTLIALGVED
jgi:adenylate kinase